MHRIPAIVIAVVGLVPVTAAADSSGNEGEVDHIDVAATRPVKPAAERWHVMPSVLVGAESFNYRETDGISVFDRNQGVLPTGEIDVDATSPRSHLFARASLKMTGGSGQYIGTTGDGTPMSGPTAGYIMDVEGIVGGRGHVGRYLMIGGFGGFGHHAWDRDMTSVNAISGYREDYTWSYGTLGARVDVTPNERTSFALEGSATVPFGGSLTETESPLIDDLKYDLAVDFSFRARLTAAYALTPQIRLMALTSIESDVILGSDSAQAMLHGQPILDSSGQPVYLAEPYSKTTRITTSVGAGYVF